MEDKDKLNDADIKDEDKVLDNNAEVDSRESDNVEGDISDDASEKDNADAASADDGKKEPKAPLGERIEDAMDEVVAGVQDFFYGEREGMAHDIPATMPDPDNEIRHINKVQTRRNIRQRLFGKKGALIFLGIMAVAMIIGLIVSKIG